MRQARVLVAVVVIAALAGLLVNMRLALAAAETVSKPPVPIGVDPGGVLVALIGDGLDYTDPQVAKRLARDGEGELAGWDLADGDRRPFAAGTAPLWRPLADLAPPPRLSVFRVPPGDSAKLAAAIGAAVQTGARIVVIACGNPDKQCAQPGPALMAAAADRFPAPLFIVWAGAQPPIGAPEPASVLFVAPGPAAQPDTAADPNAAMVAAAADAARMAATEPHLDGAALKARLPRPAVTTATPAPAGRP